MTKVAEAAFLPTGVGFTYRFNPMIGLPQDLIQSGELGEVTSFCGVHAEDFMADPLAPFNWRCEAENGGGALSDLGSHIIAMAQHLLGDIEAVSGSLSTFHNVRTTPGGESRAVLVDDQADALVRFASGAAGTISASWIATGRKMGLAFEVHGSKGSISFTHERLNELRAARGSQ